jgi:hypothetical protein
VVEATPAGGLVVGDHDGADVELARHVLGRRHAAQAQNFPVTHGR